MMDSYNLAWKLAYHINGLTPVLSDKSPDLLDTYHAERHANAQQLIDFDRTFSSSFSDQLGTSGSKSGLSHAEFVNIFNTGNGFTSGCGVEYVESLAVERSLSTNGEPPVRGDDFLAGILRSGRRLLNVKVKRFADGSHRDIQDGTGAPRFLIFTTDLDIQN